MIFFLPAIARRGPFLVRAFVCVRWPAHRKTAAVANAPIGADVHQSLDVHRHLGAQRAFHAVVLLDRLAETIDVRIIEILDAEVGADAGALDDAARELTADPENVRESDLDLLVAREIDSCNSRHSLTLPLLVLGIALANDSGHAVALDHFAVLTDRFHAATDFHDKLRL